MNEIDSIEAASRRLALALDALDAAAERRCEAARNEEAMTMQVHVLGEDRARLAGELDEAIARSRALEAADREVVKRIAAAIETIGSVLGIASEDDDEEDDEDGDDEGDEDEGDDEDDDGDDGDEDEDDEGDEDDGGDEDDEDDEDGDEDDDGDDDEDEEDDDDEDDD
jgi:hypothetical protein